MELQFNPIQLAYGVMVVGIIFCFVLSRRQKKDMRKECDAFAIPFVKLSNYISPVTPKAALEAEILEDGRVRVLPMERQPKEIRDIIKRANDDEPVRLFAQMAEAADSITKSAGINRTRREQFSDPINRILYMTHTFLNGCENLAFIDTQEKKKDFDSFLKEQVTHRMVLLRRISGSLSDEYRSLNQYYGDEMKKIEQEEKKKR